ncbi:MAG: helix-turn-helix transcriptional regulator [Methylotenera sp.]|nr:helix-turn-helix transcriptional regulator [Methylotenera sp.]MDD4926159.1 helix-turn-helix transcriptional regulator [Methylotenera sp.]
MEIKEISNRLKFARDYFELRQSAFASKCGIAYSTYQKYEMELSKPGSDAMEGFVKAGINVNWLLTGEGEMLLANINTNTSSQKIDVDNKMNEEKSNKVDPKKYFNDLTLCLVACKRLHGDGFDKLETPVQMEYAQNLYENLQLYFQTFWVFYQSVKDVDLSILGSEGIFIQLDLMYKLGAVMKFPYNPEVAAYNW